MSDNKTQLKELWSKYEAIDAECAEQKRIYDEKMRLRSLVVEEIAKLVKPKKSVIINNRELIIVARPVKAKNKNEKDTTTYYFRGKQKDDSDDSNVID